MSNLYTHAVLVCVRDDIDVTLATSDQDALEYLRTRAEENDWTSDPNFDVRTATLAQLNTLFSAGDAHDPSSTWIQIVDQVQFTVVKQHNVYAGLRFRSGPGRGNCEVLVNGRPLPVSRRSRDTSNGAWEWGYAGSGPSALAHAILTHEWSGDEDRVNAGGVFQRFKEHFLAAQSQIEIGLIWTITSDDIGTWAAQSEIAAVLQRYEAAQADDAQLFTRQEDEDATVSLDAEYIPEE